MRLKTILGHSNIAVTNEYLQMFGQDLQMDFEKFNPLDNMKKKEAQIRMQMENIIMKKWIKTDNGRVTQVIEFDDGSKIELPLDNNGNLKWFDDSKLIKKAS